MGEKISEMTEANLPLDGTEDIEIVQDGGTFRCSTQDIGDLGGLPYKFWAGYIDQTGNTAAPTRVENYNSLGRTISITRDLAGSYNIVASGSIFATNKVVVIIAGCGGGGEPKLFTWSVMNSTTIPFYCRDVSDPLGDPTDGCRLFVSIMVFP